MGPLKLVLFFVFVACVNLVNNMQKKKNDQVSFELLT